MQFTDNKASIAEERSDSCNVSNKAKSSIENVEIKTHAFPLPGPLNT